MAGREHRCRSAAPALRELPRHWFRWHCVSLLPRSKADPSHNLYWNKWSNIVFYKDNFAQQEPAAEFAVDFRNVAHDALTMNTGPALRGAAMRLMRHPQYRDAHATDDHFAPVLFVAGAAGNEADKGPNTAPAEVWELINMCNTQFQFGSWE
jgi:aromatic ring-opening dioxygenase catalytic subunit (LigB family)